MLNEEDRARAARGPHNYEALRALLRQVNSIVPDEDFKPPFGAIARDLREAINVYGSTRNGEGEAELVRALSSLIGELNTLMNADLPDTTSLHARAARADAHCEEFESKRDGADWTDDMTRSEEALYGEVDQVLVKSDRQSKSLLELLRVLHEMKALVLRVDEVKPTEDLNRIEESLRNLQQQEAREDECFRMMLTNLTAELNTCESEHASNREAVEKLTSHIKKLIDDLADAHLTVWRSEKRKRAVERSLQLVAKKKSLNEGLAAHEENETLELRKDATAQVKVAKLANVLLTEATRQFQDIRANHEQRTVADVFELLVNECMLISRKYYKTAISIFAAESSIEILHQEQEGILVKKQRSNAAKKSAWVADCNRQYADVQARIDTETAEKSRMQDELAQLRDNWEDNHSRLLQLNLSDALRARVTPLEDQWRATLARLEQVEKEQLAKIELANHLDAGFLSNMNLSYEAVPNH